MHECVAIRSPKTIYHIGMSLPKDLRHSTLLAFRMPIFAKKYVNMCSSNCKEKLILQFEKCFSLLIKTTSITVFKTLIFIYRDLLYMTIKKILIEHFFIYHYAKESNPCLFFVILHKKNKPNFVYDCKVTKL